MLPLQLALKSQVKRAHDTMLLNHVIKMYKKWSGYSLIGRTSSAGPELTSDVSYSSNI